MLIGANGKGTAGGIANGALRRRGGAPLRPVYSKRSTDESRAVIVDHWFGTYSIKVVPPVPNLLFDKVFASAAGARKYARVSGKVLEVPVTDLTGRGQG